MQLHHEVDDDGGVEEGFDEGGDVVGGGMSDCVADRDTWLLWTFD